MNSQNPANILIFNFDEEGNEYNNDHYIKNFLYNVGSKNPNIIVICTQNSISRTDKHLQHIIGDKLPGKYKRFSKVDATRQSDLKKIVYKNLKNVRMRIYYNTETVYVDNVFNRFSKQSSKKRSIFNFSNNSIDENKEKYNGSKTNNKQIIIKEYKYRRYTVEGENGRSGKGGIMTSIVFKMNGLEYQYIFCNYNFDNSNLQEKLNKIITQNNISIARIIGEKPKMNINKPENHIKLTKTTINLNPSKNNTNKIKELSEPIFFIYFVSLNNIEYGKYFNENNNIIIKLEKKKKNIPIEYFSKISVVSHKKIVSKNNIQILNDKYKQKIIRDSKIKINYNNINNIESSIAEKTINLAIQNIDYPPKNLLPFINNGENIIITCPICNNIFLIEKNCGHYRCRGVKNINNTENLFIKELTNNPHATKNECNELSKKYTNTCLTPLIIITMIIGENKEINVCLEDPYYI